MGAEGCLNRGFEHNLEILAFSAKKFFECQNALMTGKNGTKKPHLCSMERMDDLCLEMGKDGRRNNWS